MRSSRNGSPARRSGVAEATEERPPLPHREIISRVVHSNTFARSERLSTLLIYVCDMTLKGRAAEINEQKIGHEVFGRARDYDSSIDGIVRTQASRLRKRLEAYYEQEGAQEPIRIAIPRGSYVAQFEAQAAQSGENSCDGTETPDPIESHPLAPHPATALPGSGLRNATTAWGICGFLAAALCALFVFTRLEHTRLEAIHAAEFTHPLWSQMFKPGQTTLEVPGDSGLVLFHSFEHRDLALNEYMVGAYRQSGPHDRHEPPAQANGLAAEFASRRYTSIVDLEAATLLTRIAQAANSTLKVRYARDIRPNDFKTGNVILFGAAEANPWVELFERNMNFSLHNDYVTHVFRVLNRVPRSGEPRNWASTPTDPEHRVFGLIGYLPNLSGSGRALVVEGTTMAGAEAAMDFLADDSQVLPFLNRIRLPNNDIPHFELLVTTQNTGASAIHSSIVAWRTTE